MLRTLSETPIFLLIVSIFVISTGVVLPHGFSFSVDAAPVSPAFPILAFLSCATAWLLILTPALQGFTNLFVKLAAGSVLAFFALHVLLLAGQWFTSLHAFAPYGAYSLGLALFLLLGKTLDILRHVAPAWFQDLGWHSD